MEPKFEIIKFDPEIDSLDRLKTQISKAYKINEEFFGKSVGKINYRIIYTRKEMDEVMGHPTADWNRGTVKEGIITVVSENKMEEVTKGIHKSSTFNQLLVHETTHVFEERLFRFTYPIWLDEGLAGYIAGQGKNDEEILKYKIPEFSEIHTIEQWNKKPNYPIGFSLTKYLIKKFGKDKLLNLLTLLNKEDSFEVFSSKFQKEMSVTFNKSVEEWIEDLHKRHSKIN